MLFISYMGKVQCFEVVYENGHGVFRAGQTLTAKLLLELTEMKKVEAVRVHLKVSTASPRGFGLPLVRV